MHVVPVVRNPQRLPHAPVPSVALAFACDADFRVTDGGARAVAERLVVTRPAPPVPFTAEEHYLYRRARGQGADPTAATRAVYQRRTARAFAADYEVHGRFTDEDGVRTFVLGGAWFRLAVIGDPESVDVFDGFHSFTPEDIAAHERGEWCFVTLQVERFDDAGAVLGYASASGIEAGPHYDARGVLAGDDRLLHLALVHCLFEEADAMATEIGHTP